MPVIGMLNRIGEELTRKRYDKPRTATAKVHDAGMYCPNCDNVLHWVGKCNDVECAGMCEPACGGYELVCTCRGEAWDTKVR